MNPKKASELFKTIPGELGIDPEVVNNLLEFYWSNVRKEISNLSHPRLNLHGLGAFEIKVPSLHVTIERYKRHINKLASVSKTLTYARYENVKSRLELLLKMKEILDGDAVLKKEVWKKRLGTKYYGYEKSNKHLEE